MAEQDDTRGSGAPSGAESNEPTQVLPVSSPDAGGAGSPWARPADASRNWAAPDGTTRFEPTAPIQPAAAPSAYPAGQTGQNAPQQPGAWAAGPYPGQHPSVPAGGAPAARCPIRIRRADGVRSRL